ncbi:hypothetical protein ES703_58983 [subsurface metagenome]
MRWRGIQKFNVIEANEYRGLLGQPLGKKFHVNGLTGSDGYSGENKNNPLKTIKHALSKCVNDRDDYIFVHDCWAQETFPITIDKSRVHIIGVGVPSMNLYPQLFGDGENIFELNANYVEIAGFGFVSVGASAIVSGAATPSYGWIHHCTFATAALSLLNGIAVVGSQMGNMLIEDNIFGSNITNDGITGQFVNCIIRNNIFRDCANVAVNLGGVEIGAIIGNYFYQVIPASTAGWGITLALNANGGIIANNVGSATGDETAGGNPYRDLSSGSTIGTVLNGWVNNHWGAQATPQIPAVV